MKQLVKKAERHLIKTDSVLAGLIEQHGPCTLFDGNALIHKPGFHVLAWAIINQQLSVASAKSIETKLLKQHRAQEFTARRIAALSDAQLAACGLSRQKIRYLRALCDAVNTRTLQLDDLAADSSERVTEVLTALPGIGPWTADMYLMFSLARLDILPLGDLALRKAFSQHYPIADNATPAEYHRLAQGWRPYRTIASWYLWASVD
jgi:3-methyladenine DNA glycosylase/8-oxoguanine DNA glycosylase